MKFIYGPLPGPRRRTGGNIAEASAMGLWLVIVSQTRKAQCKNADKLQARLQSSGK